MRFSEDVYVYEWTDYFDNNCNSFYIGGEVRALIDPGLSRYVPQLLEQMRLDGIEPDDIRYIVNTHSHPDHFEGSSFFAGSEAKIALHQKEIEFLNGPGGQLYSLFGMPRPRFRSICRWMARSWSWAGKHSGFSCSRDTRPDPSASTARSARLSSVAT
jgi:glyoxylase-like metal-dependent hydrolase (beta-lactamase superfamily II)